MQGRDHRRGAFLIGKIPLTQMKKPEDAVKFACWFSLVFLVSLSVCVLVAGELSLFLAFSYVNQEDGKQPKPAADASSARFTEFRGKTGEGQEG